MSVSAPEGIQELLHSLPSLKCDNSASLFSAISERVKVAPRLVEYALSRQASKRRHHRRLRKHMLDMGMLRAFEKEAGLRYGDVIFFGDAYKGAPASTVTKIRPGVKHLRRLLATRYRVVLTGEFR